MPALRGERERARAGKPRSADQLRSEHDVGKVQPMQRDRETPMSTNAIIFWAVFSILNSICCYKIGRFQERDRLLRKAGQWKYSPRRHVQNQMEQTPFF